MKPEFTCRSEPAPTLGRRAHGRRGRWWRQFIGLLVVGFWGSAAVAQELHTAAAVRGLTIQQAQQHPPVKLRGVVTFFDENLYSRFIQDETAGIYLREASNTPALNPGQWVEVEGVASPGEYAPVIEPRRVVVVGTAPLPGPKR
ncbi:MAG: hypothetical protein QM813_14465 [Verrucomicrobiota bacterium]